MNLTGLTKEEVKQRIRQGKVNYDTTTLVRVLNRFY